MGIQQTSPKKMKPNETNKLVVHHRREPDRSGPGYTVSSLVLDECGKLCDILEDEDRGLTQDMPLETIKAIKVYGKTAIPKGCYRVRMDRVSPKFEDRPYAKKYGGCLPYLENVPGYEGVLVHPLTTPADTDGCIGPGEAVPGKGRIIKSTKAFYDLMDFYLKKYEEMGLEIWWEIT